MSINHFSANPPSSNHRTYFPTHFLTPNSTAGFWASDGTADAMFCGQTAALSFNLNKKDDEELSMEDQSAAAADDRQTNTTSPLFEQEKLFEKPLTPSDVGKLNRLVIPKQHAEKHFPLNGGDAGENGLLLGFEDEAGKPWRFRYSYWNSSQSYVLTKGWSRFVKEKRLGAGDVVLFARHRNDIGRLFIGWRRRNSDGGGQGGAAKQPAADGGGGWSGGAYRDNPYPSPNEGSSSVLYQTDTTNTENQSRGRSGRNPKRRLRLFGVNLEWSEEESTSPEGSAVSSQGQHCADHHRTWI